LDSHIQDLDHGVFLVFLDPLGGGEVVGLMIGVDADYFHLPIIFFSIKTIAQTPATEIQNINLEFSDQQEGLISQE
jgi:hypothetical protein